MIGRLGELHMAQDMAQAHVKEKYGDFVLTQATVLPIRLPNGWRFPYDLYVGPFRVRHLMLILFVSDQGTLDVEWDDFADGKYAEAVKNMNTVVACLQSLPDDFPSAQEVRSRVTDEEPDAVVESTELVWALDEKVEMVLRWRVGLIKGILREVRMVGPKGAQTLDRRGNLVDDGESQPCSLRVAPDWNLGNARFRQRSGNLTIKTKGTDKSPTTLHSQWRVWCCMAHVAEYLAKLGYGEFSPHNVHIEFLSSDVKGAAFATVNGVPTITFSRDRGWDRSLSIVLHEMGHALWSLLYTRPPKILENEAVSEVEREGVAEGFCDYFAAALLSENNAPVGIGGELKPQPKLYRLPRMVDGDVFQVSSVPDSDPPARYLIGQKWANFLFDLRRVIYNEKIGTLQEADRLIFQAHLKPVVLNPPNPITPMSVYAASLWETAVAQNIPLPEETWKALINKHSVMSADS